MPITAYRDYLNQAINIGNWKRGGDLQLQTQADIRREYEALKAQGWFNSAG